MLVAHTEEDLHNSTLKRDSLMLAGGSRRGVAG